MNSTVAVILPTYMSVIFVKAAVKTIVCVTLFTATLLGLGMVQLLCATG